MPALNIIVSPDFQTILGPGLRRKGDGAHPLRLDVSKELVNGLVSRIMRHCGLDDREGPRDVRNRLEIIETDCTISNLIYPATPGILGCFRDIGNTRFVITRYGT